MSPHSRGWSVSRNSDDFSKLAQKRALSWRRSHDEATTSIGGQNAMARFRRKLKDPTRVGEAGVEFRTDVCAVRGVHFCITVMLLAFSRFTFVAAQLRVVHRWQTKRAFTQMLATMKASRTHPTRNRYGRSTHKPSAMPGSYLTALTNLLFGRLGCESPPAWHLGLRVHSGR